MSDSEFSVDTNSTWLPPSAFGRTVTDGVNLREVVLDGIDLETKSAILDLLKAYQLDVTGVDSDTYTVDLSKWDRKRSEQIVHLLKTISGNLPEMEVKGTESISEAGMTQSAMTVLPLKNTEEEGKAFFEELKPPLESNITRNERRLPTQPHPAEELDFEYLTRPTPVRTSPIYQKNELINMKPMLMREETQSTMGSADIGVRKVNKNRFSFKILLHWGTYPFRVIKRLKICRFIRKHIWRRKSKEEKMRKEKAFAVYTSLLEDGSRHGREFRESLKPQESTLRTVATNTWSGPVGDEWSLTSSISKVNRAVNAVVQMVEVAVDTLQLVQSPREFQSIPKVFSEPEEDEIIWCPCQFITSSFLYKCISKCLTYLLNWESASTSLIKEDMANQREELKEMRLMLLGVLDFMEKARKSEKGRSS